MGEELEVVDGEHDGPASHRRRRTSAVVDNPGTPCTPAQPHVFSEHTARTLVPGDSCHDHRIQIGQGRMRASERLHDIERGQELGLLRGQSQQLPDEILLRPTDIARNTPEEVHRDVDCGHTLTWARATDRSFEAGPSARLLPLVRHGSIASPPAGASSR